MICVSGSFLCHQHFTGINHSLRDRRETRWLCQSSLFPFHICFISCILANTFLTVYVKLLHNAIFDFIETEKGREKAGFKTIEKNIPFNLLINFGKNFATLSTSVKISDMVVLSAIVFYRGTLIRKNLSQTLLTIWRGFSVYVF